jgi:cytosine/adenosine deaminase-related metal-dependent hydrolase
MRKISADKVYTIEDGIVENGVLIINNDNKIVAVSTRDNFENAELEIYTGSICPGFVNAHCHLELSHLRNKIEPHSGLVNFIEQIIKIRHEQSIDDRLQAIADAEQEMYNNGIIAVGDISNEDITIHQKTKENLYYHTFIETIGLHPSIAEKRFEEAQLLGAKYSSNNLVNTIAPHAPYSTSIQLQQLIYNLNQISTIHNQESMEEARFFIDKTGDFIGFYDKLKLDIAFFNATQKNSLQSLIDILPQKSNMLFVHNTFSDETDLKTIVAHNQNSYLCACVKANLFIENKVPDLNLWANNSKNICLGTDSLASNTSLSIWDEIKIIQQCFPEYQLETLLQYATINGAKFLGIDDWAGSFKVGKSPGVNLIINNTIKRII